jgi:hypothetical protein
MKLPRCLLSALVGFLVSAGIAGVTSSITVPESAD